MAGARGAVRRARRARETADGLGEGDRVDGGGRVRAAGGVAKVGGSAGREGVRDGCAR